MGGSFEAGNIKLSSEQSCHGTGEGDHQIEAVIEAIIDFTSSHIN